MEARVSVYMIESSALHLGSKLMKKKALTKFEQRAKRIESLIRCADVYGLNVLALLRNEEPDINLVKKIITEGGYSTQALTTDLLFKVEEQEAFEKEAHLKAICEQIVFASYVATEDYLIAKFKEYYSWAKEIDPSEVDKQHLQDNKIFLSGLENIKKYFRKHLDVRLNKFDHPQVSVFTEAKWFCPESCWEGIKKLSAFRHDIAHAKDEERMRPIMLVDAYSALDFCRSYTLLFDCNYDNWFYDGVKVRFENA
jgi:hypothetical protein